MSSVDIISYLLMFIEKPIDYDDFVNADPEECATKFFANAKAQKFSMWFILIMKWLLTVSVVFALIPLTGADWFNVFIDTQDYYFMCAMGQPGFTEELFNGDWVYQKLYIKQIGRDLNRNPTPIFQTRLVFKSMEVFDAMANGAI